MFNRRLFPVARNLLVWLALTLLLIMLATDVAGKIGWIVGGKDSQLVIDDLVGRYLPRSGTYPAVIGQELEWDHEKEAYIPEVLIVSAEVDRETGILSMVLDPLFSYVSDPGTPEEVVWVAREDEEMFVAVKYIENGEHIGAAYNLCPSNLCTEEKRDRAYQVLDYVRPSLGLTFHDVCPLAWSEHLNDKGLGYPEVRWLPVPIQDRLDQFLFAIFLEKEAVAADGYRMSWVPSRGSCYMSYEPFPVGQQAFLIP